MAKIEYYEGKAYNPETGERYTKKQLEKFNDEALEQNQKKYIENVVDYGLSGKYRLTKITKKSTYKTKVNIGVEFNKMFRDGITDVINSGELNAREIAFMCGCAANIQYPNNDVQINCEYLTLEKLGKLFGSSKNITTTVVELLEEKRIIKVVRGAKVPPVIYFNPFIVCSGKDVNTDVYNFFKDTKWNDTLSIDMESKYIQ